MAPWTPPTTWREELDELLEDRDLEEVLEVRTLLEEHRFKTTGMPLPGDRRSKRRGRKRRLEPVVAAQPVTEIENNEEREPNIMAESFQHYRGTVSPMGLLTHLSEDQRAVLAAMAGMDQDGPRLLEEVAALLQQEPEVIFLQAALAMRALHQELVTVDPLALRLVTSTLVEYVALDGLNSGIVSLQRLVPAIRAANFPTRLSQKIVSVWSGGQPGVSHQAGVQIITPAGEQLTYVTTPIPAPGLGGMFTQLMDFPGTAWPEPGLYTAEIWVDGAPIGAYTIPVYKSVPDEEQTDGEG